MRGLIFQFFYRGPFLGQKPKIRQNVAFCKNHPIWAWNTALEAACLIEFSTFDGFEKLWKLRILWTKVLMQKIFFCLSLAVRHLPKNYWILAWNTSLEAPWPRDSESLDRYEKNKKLRILWAKYCDSAYFHFLLKLVNPLLTKLLVVQKIV